MFVKHKFSDDPEVFQYRPPRTNSWIFRMRRRKNTGGLGYLKELDSPHNGFAVPASPFGCSPLKQLPPTDVAVLNWVAGFWDYRSIPALANHCRAVVWRLSDMQPFTGGCFYNVSCQGYKTNCGKCPALGSNRNSDMSRRSLLLKRRIVEKLRPGTLTIVAQSRWIQKEIQASSVFCDLPVVHIANGIDTTVFKPVPNPTLRAKLGLTNEDRVILFVAQDLTNPRKGGEYFRSVVHTVAQRYRGSLAVLALGKQSLYDIDGAKVVQLDSVSREEDLAACYSLADAFVTCATQDNLPNTVLEAMACGTAVVGFRVGGLLDQVEDGRTGRLVEVGNVPQMAEALLQLFGSPQATSEMGKLGRRKALHEFNIQTQARRYVELYSSLLVRA